MRVALLTHNAQDGDAIGNQVAEKLTFFLGRGADVRVFAESRHRLHPAVHAYVCVLDPAAPGGEDWDFLVSADLIIAEYGHYYPLLGILPLLVGGKPRILLDYHGVTPAELWGGQNREGLELGLRHRGLVWCADAAVTHSRFTRLELLEASAFPEERCYRLGHPLEAEHFRAGPPIRDLRHRLGLGPVRLLLFVGRIAPNKRVPVLIEALAQLREQDPPVHAAIIGDAGDVYETEAQRCQERAAELGITERLHFLGHVDDETLGDAYRSADVLVMPSRHEGFCIPVIEAMASGLPVVAARAGALPETIAGAALTFTPDDAADLARQLRRVLGSSRADPPIQLAAPRLRVAVVAFRYGNDFVGGAETSLRTIAEALHRAGHHVEVFTTCTQSENHWSNQLPEGTVTRAGLDVHRFRIDPHDRNQHLESVRTILESDGQVTEQVEAEYLRHSIHSSRLIEALRRRAGRLDAILVGPYIFGLTADVAREFAEKTVLVPCFHDEPFARLRIWQEAYSGVGGLLYHSPEEKELGEAELGYNHPSSFCVGSWMDTARAGNPEQGADLVGGRPYLVYCGRYSLQKGLPTLLDFAGRYASEHPGRFTFAFLGQGDVAIPHADWARDLGFVSEEVKRDLLAGAAALVQLSRYESLSLCALEAWTQGVPLLADQHCAVLAGHLQRCGGGRAVNSYETFAAALDDLWEHPERWQAMGRQGQAYVQAQYGSAADFTARLEQALGDLAVPLAERLRRRGLQRAADFARPAWRERFADLVENLLDAPARLCREQIDVEPRNERRTVSAGQEAVLVPVQVVNRGTHAVLPEGPARFVLRSRLVDATGQPTTTPEAETSLPALLMPGQTLAAAISVPVPNGSGSYHVAFWAQRATATSGSAAEPLEEMEGNGHIHLIVQNALSRQAEHCCTPLLDVAQRALVEANRLQRLPDDYTDVTEGRFAAWKRWIKRKLLGNFKRAYVDVLSRQQSAVNQRVLSALNELTEACATLAHAQQAGGTQERGPESGDLAVLLYDLADQLAASQRHCAALETRLAHLERKIKDSPKKGTDPLKPRGKSPFSESKGHKTRDDS